MITATTSFEQKKQHATSILSSLIDFVKEGLELGVQLHPDLIRKMEKSIQNAAEERLKVALIGGFSEGKTSIAAAWLEELDRKSMKISQQESSNEVAIYKFKDQLEIIDTPGLFGFKEKTNATTAEIERYKDITKRFVSEAHLVLYVMNPSNPIKESHSDDLKWLFRALNLLPRTVFVLSRFDEVADMSDSTEFQDRFQVKKTSVLKRLTDVLALTPEEQKTTSIVAVSANPFDLGVEHWLDNLADFRKLSRIEELQTATHKKISENGGLFALVNDVKNSVISDVITKQLPIASEGYLMLAEEANRITEIKNNQEIELKKIAGNIDSSRVRLRGRLLRYFEDLQFQAKGVGPDTFNDFMHREIGDEGRLVQQRIQEIFNDEVGAISRDLSRIEIGMQNELLRYNDVVGSLGKKGIQFLAKPGVLTNTNVIAVRDGINAATRVIGLDVGKYLKFKPWGATKLASGIGSALAVVGVALEIWDTYKEQERKAKFIVAIDTMIGNFKDQAKEVIALIDAPNFSEQFFPDFAELRQQLTGIGNEMSTLQETQLRFKKWYENGIAIDAEFREVDQSRYDK